MTTTTSAASAAAPAADEIDQGSFDTPGIARGFMPAAEPPKVGVRVLAITKTGELTFANFAKIPGTDGVLFSYGYKSDGEELIELKAWRYIPSNWK